MLEESAGFSVYLLPGIKKLKVTPQNLSITQTLPQECSHWIHPLVSNVSMVILNVCSLILMFSFDIKETIAGILLDLIWIEWKQSDFILLYSSSLALETTVNPQRSDFYS